MKKNTLLLLCLSLNFTFSQVIFEDDFDGSGPGIAGWTVYDEDGLTVDPNVGFTSAWVEGQNVGTTAPPDPVDLVVQSTSWYTPAGTSDDWLVTPAMALTGLTGDPMLTWEENAPDAAFADGYEVRVSTTGNTPADFTDAPVFTIAAASGGVGVWASQSIYLNDYAGNSEVYIAWRNTSTDKFILQINNVKVEVSPFDTGISTTGETQDQYTQIPLKQIAAIGTNAIINNLGDPVTGAIATVTVADGSGTVYTEDSAAYIIGAATSQPVTFAGYVPTAIGTYTTTYTVAIAETDHDLSNNTTTSNDTEVTLNTYARDNGNVIGSHGVGNTVPEAQLGQQFDIIETEDILSVTFQLENGGDLLTGTTTFVKVWSMAGGIPDAIIAQTNPVTILTGSNLYTADIIGGAFTLSPGSYVVTVEEGLDNITLALTDEIHTPGTTFVNFPVATTPWAHNEDYFFSNSYVLRPNFSNNTLDVESFETENIAIGLYPNPANNMLTISNPNGVSLQEATIIDVTGRVVKTYNLGGTIVNEKTIDVSSLNAAAYFVTIKSSHGAVTKKLTIN